MYVNKTKEGIKVDNVKSQREWLKANFNLLSNIETDQKQKFQQPPIQKDLEEGAEIIDLPEVTRDVVIKKDVFDCLMDRKSNRVFTEEALSLEELSFLLYMTQGVKKVVGKVNFATFRTVPSGGARHPFETYMVVNNVSGLKKGVYRYLASEHKLIHLFDENNLEEKVSEAVSGQKFVASAPVIFIWSCIPYRSEWRYNVAAHKTILQDSGHLCQNLYLACEAIGAGTVAIGDYAQEIIDEFLMLDGEDEFVIYAAPVGKVSAE
ncbi:SagB/ThcOx family dehydrogenase [Clostridium sp. YIM B02515]|uniref:SagB/ThcOx family dehydrogenase n=1 Tax=Clostridium rhizosphaerae TaxID=2803861 RepID=A0ABS1TA42_9CLOT|nr:SagB/ThcOx family dehydrogenase [Clostridium rhizosphaerae]MBL4936190.1 SagB/ThcOx family dehydrogenase [Clostridium rhizosphaerae]